MARPAPRDPELLKAVIAVLRETADPAHPATEGVVKVANRVRREVDPALAARLIERFERINPSIRKKALGEWFDRPAELAPREMAGEPGPSPVESGGIGGPGGGLDGDAFGPVGGFTGTVSDGQTGGDTPTRPEYTVTYHGMFAEAETSWDGATNSDEVYFQTFAVHYDENGQNHVRPPDQHPITGQIYQDVDDGEPRIGPVAAVWHGVHTPMSLTVVAFEHDYGDPDKYREEIKALVEVVAAVIAYLYPPAAVASALVLKFREQIVDAINWVLDTEDDMIGEPFVEVLDAAKIEEYAGKYPSPYTSTKHGVSLDSLQGHFFSEHRGSGAHYAAAFQVDRDPPLDRNETVVLL